MNERGASPVSEDRIRHWLQALPRPRADEHFRARLRQRFVDGPAPTAAPRPVERLGWRMGRRAIMASCAVVAALFAAVSLLDRGPEWRLAGVLGGGDVWIDGKSVPITNVDEIASHLRRGGLVALPEGAQLDLDLFGVARVQIAGGTRVELPGGPGRWFRRSRSALLSAGEIRVSTVPGGRASALRVRTPEAQAVVVGTTYAVVRRQDASCVCVLEGQIWMEAGARSDSVRAGSRRTVYRDGRPPLLEPIQPMERMKLTMLREQVLRASRP